MIIMCMEDGESLFEKPWKILDSETDEQIFFDLTFIQLKYYNFFQENFDNFNRCDSISH